MIRISTPIKIDSQVAHELSDGWNIEYSWCTPSRGCAGVLGIFDSWYPGNPQVLSMMGSQYPRHSVHAVGCITNHTRVMTFRPHCHTGVILCNFPKGVWYLMEV